MYSSDEHHLQAILATFEKEATEKYRAGVKEHGGHLWEKPGMLDEAIKEAIDLVVYLYTLRDQRDTLGRKFESFKESVDNPPID